MVCRAERALEVDAHDRVEVVLAHVEDHRVADDPGVVHEDVELAERLDRGVDHLAGALEVGHVAVVRHRVAAALLDQLYDDVGVLFAGAVAPHRAAEVVDHDFGAVLGKFERVATTDPVRCAGDDGDLPVKQSHESDATSRSSMRWLPRATKMRFGVSLGRLNPAFFAAVTEAADALGFESVWLPEHLVLPVGDGGLAVRRRRAPAGAADHADLRRRRLPVVPRRPDDADPLGHLRVPARHPSPVRRRARVRDARRRERRSRRGRRRRRMARIGMECGRARLRDARPATRRGHRRVPPAVDRAARSSTTASSSTFDAVCFEPKPVQQPPPISIGGESEAGVAPGRAHRRRVARHGPHASSRSRRSRGAAAATGVHDHSRRRRPDSRRRRARSRRPASTAHRRAVAPLARRRSRPCKLFQAIS